MATPAQSAEALLALMSRVSDFTCDEFEEKDLVSFAIEKGRCPLAICPCGKVVLAENVPGIYQAVPVEDRGVWLPAGIYCGACVVAAGGFSGNVVPLSLPATSPRTT
jgi:hypothetical protein